MAEQGVADDIGDCLSRLLRWADEEDHRKEEVPQCAKVVSGVDEEGRCKLYGRHKKTSHEVRLDFGTAFGSTEARFELVDSAVVEEDEAEYATDDLERTVEDREYPNGQL